MTLVGCERQIVTSERTAGADFPDDVLGLVGDPEISIRTGGDGNRVSTGVGAAVWATRNQELRLCSGRRHPGHRELISLVEPEVAIRAGRDFARVGVSGWQCVHGHRADGRESVDGVMPGVGEPEAAIGARHGAIWGRARYGVLDYAGGRGRGWHRCEERPEDEAGDDGDSAPRPQRLPAAELNRQVVEFTLGPLA